MLLDDAGPSLAGAGPERRLDPFEPDCRELPKRDLRVLDDAKVNAARDVAEQPVEHLLRNPLARADLAPVADARLVLEIDPPAFLSFKYSGHLMLPPRGHGSSFTLSAPPSGGRLLRQTISFTMLLIDPAAFLPAAPALALTMRVETKGRAGTGIDP